MTLPNIKEARSEAIIEKFGIEGTVAILDADINRLTEIAGINEKRLPPIQKAWEEKKCLRELYNFFTKHQVSASLADKIYKQWGKASLKVMMDNPYRLVEIRGIGFLTADGIAHKICANVPEDKRATACIHYVLQEALSKQSDLCVSYPNLKKSVIAILADCDKNLGKNVDPQVYLKTVPDCLKNNLHIFTLVKDLETNEGYVYLSYVWDKEYYIAKSLWERKVFNHADNKCSDNDIGVEEVSLEKFSGKPVKLDESQKNAIKSAFGHKISVITGPGGSGKSTICKCICSLAHKKGLKVRLMSPTGKAAQVLSDKTGCDASTIHRGLKMTPDEEFPRSDITEDILLVDEISMSGLDTMFAITSAMEENPWGHMVFVGDKNQLPSVSPGNFLSDIIESECANVVTLDKIHRMDEKSFISILANDISKGKVVDIPKDAADIKWHDLKIDTFHQDLLDFIDAYLKNGNDIEDLQIMSPMKKGDCGVYKINEVLQKKMAAINGTEDSFIQIGFHKYHTGDRVIQLENNYDKMVFNGDMGIVKSVGEKMVDPTISDKKERFVTIDFFGEELTYFGTEVEQLQLAWAITVHKFQGSSSKNIVFIMANEQQIMMSKELVYTAFTRAEKQLDIFGHENMLRIAPTRSIVRKRFTNVKRIIEEFKTNKKLLQVVRTEKA
jgi:exodeoxyribonuclease V alpha subunit